MALILGIDKFMSECRALTNLVGNGVACVVVSRWEGELDPVKLREVMANPLAIGTEIADEKPVPGRALTAMALLRIGIDLGGTKIAGIALDASGRVLAERRIATPARRLRRFAPGHRRLVASSKPRPAAPAPSGWASPARWCRRPAGSRTPTRPGSTAGRSATTSRGFSRPPGAAGERRQLPGGLRGRRRGGAGGRRRLGGDPRHRRGLGHRAAGRALSGRQRIAGEWGHNPLPSPRDDERPGPACYCGRHGCLETWLSGPGLAADHARRTDLAMTDLAMTNLAMTGSDRRGDARRRCGGARDLRGLARPARARHRGRRQRARPGRDRPRRRPLDDFRDLRRAPRAGRPHIFGGGFATPIRPSRHGDASGCAERHGCGTNRMPPEAC